MHISRRYGNWTLFAGLIVLIFVLATVLPISRATAASSPEQLVQRAWQRAQEAGAYRFATEIEQITYPAPALVNVGRSSRKDTLYIEGQADLSERALLLTLWNQGGNVSNRRDGVEVRIEGDRAHGRQIGGVWQEIDDFTDAFAPGNDLMAYLAGARNIREMGIETRPLPDATGLGGEGGRQLTFTRYSYEVDGPAFAEYLRDQLENRLRERGELPLGLTLDAPRQYLSVTGQGEVWIDSEGLPLRLAVHLVYPEQHNGERIEADIKTDFSNFAPRAKAEGPAAWLASSLGLPRSQEGLQRVAQQSAIAAGVLGLLPLLLIHRRSKKVYVIIALVIIFSMIVTPLLHSQRVYAFFRRWTAQAEKNQTEQNATRELQDELVASTWDPHQDPLAPQRISESENVAYSVPDPQSLIPNLYSTQENGDEDPDSDGDGLTDAQELHSVLGTDPDNPDSDGDGLTDGVEVFRLGTDPRPGIGEDSDGDGINDYVEVQGFHYSDVHWFTNPNDPDTNNDGQLDTIECPDLVGIASLDGSDEVVCDTDDDGIPDPFDYDDDGDGVSDWVDLSPHSIVDRDGKRSQAGGLAPFDADHPFTLMVDSLQDDEPVFVDIQLRPITSTHLAYALNVLDWPSGDTEAQIQRVKDTTFATTDNPEAASQDASAASGDMRLIPLLEIEMTGDSVPLALTNPAVTVQVSGDITGAVNMERQGGDVGLSFSFEDTQQVYEVEISEGSCLLSSPQHTFSNVSSGEHETITNAKLPNLADGEHVITVSGGGSTACATIGNVVNGPYRNQMIDPVPLEPYGISVREADENGTLLAYVPLSVVSDETGGGKAAFSARMVYWPGANRAWEDAQQVRVVWALQMLTDWCDTTGFSPSGDAENDPGQYSEELEVWCADSGNRTMDQVQIVHTYDEEWYLTGLSVREDHGLDVSIAYEDPATDDEPETDEDLWLLARGLEVTYVAGGDRDDNGLRDIGVVEYRGGEQIADSTIKGRFDSESTPPDGDDMRWGIPKDALQVETISYEHQDYVAHIAMTETVRILGQFPTTAAPTLLFAREEHYRSASMEAGNWQTATLIIDVDPAVSPVETIASLNWAAFRYTDESGPDGQTIGWESYPINEYWDQMEIKFFDLFTELFPDDSDDVNLGRMVIARSYYVALFNGVASQVQSGAELRWTADPNIADSDAELAGDAYSAGTGYGKKLYSVAESVIQATYSHYKHTSENVVATIVDVATGAVEDVVEETVEYAPFLDSLGKGIKDYLVSDWVTLFKGTGLQSVRGKTAARASAGIALVGAIAVVGLTIWAATQSSGIDVAMNVLSGLTVIMAIQGAVGTIVSTVKAAKAAGSVSQAISNGTKTFSAIKSNVSKGAVVALIIGVAVTWGAFILEMSLTGAWGSMAFKEALAAAIASTIVLVIMFAISAIPVVGAIISAVIGLIDAAVSLLCSFFLPEEQQEHWAAGMFCGGITGLATTVLQWTLYSGTVMVDLEPEDWDRLQFSDFDQDDLVEPAKGISVGNQVMYGVSITNTIDLVNYPLNLGTTYWYQYNDGTLRSSAFEYMLQENDSEFETYPERNTMQGEWQYVDGTEPDWNPIHTYQYAEPVFLTATVRSEGGIPLTEAGINVAPQFFLSEGYAIPVQECYAGICTIQTEKDTLHYNLGQSARLDVFPATLDGFYSLTPMGGGYALAWGQGGDVTFRALRDADGDGLTRGADSNDGLWDSDYDGLGDWYEAQIGSNPQSQDSDGDGLGDYTEARLGTSPTRPDSDGDGLRDGLEVWHQDTFDQDGDGDYDEWVGGWEFVYTLNEDGTALTTWVSPNPLDADADGDTLTDFQEKTYGFHPWVPSSPNVLTLESVVQEITASGVYTTSDGFVKPGDTFYYNATVKNELFNRYAQGLLSTDFPQQVDAWAVPPQSFILYPQEQEAMAGDVDVDGAAATGVYSLTQVAGALITDWGEIAGDAGFWLPFEDASDATTFLDRSGSLPPHDGLCVGTCSTVDDGIYGKTLRLDGSGYVTSDFAASETDYALSLWFKTSQDNGGLFSTGAQGVQLSLEGGKVCSRVPYNWGTYQVIVAFETHCTWDTRYDDGEWHHVVQTFGSTVGGHKLYVDGLLKGSGIRTAEDFPNQYGVDIGRSLDPDSLFIDYFQFTGQIDDVRIFDQGLDQPQVQNLFTQSVFQMEFDEDAGWKDHSVFGNDGACQIAYWYGLRAVNACPTRVSGISGQAAQFDGDDHISIGSNPSLDLSDGRFTIAAWVYPQDIPHEQCISSWYGTSWCELYQPQGILGYNSGETDAYPSLKWTEYRSVEPLHTQLRFSFGTGSEWVKPTYKSPDDVLTKDAWNHVALTFDQGTLKLYINGELEDQDSAVFAGALPAPTQEFNIGRSGDKGWVYIDRVSVIDEGDGAGNAEIKIMFDGDLVAFCTGLADGDACTVQDAFQFQESATLEVWEIDAAGDGDCCADDLLISKTFSTLEPSYWSQEIDGQGGYGPTKVRLVLGDASHWAYSNDAVPFRGRLDGVQILPRVLDEEAVKDLYRSSTTALHLRFDEPPGETVFQDATEQHEGTCSGDACPTAGVAGRVNQAAWFDAAEKDRVALGNLGDFDTATVAAWVNRAGSTGTRETVVSYKEDSGCGFALVLTPEPNHYPKLWVNVGGDWQSVVHEQSVPPDTWVHLAGTYDGETLRLYRDGQEVGSTSAAGAMQQCTAGSAVGSHSSQDQQYFPGRIDEVHIFGQALSASEIEELYGAAPVFQMHFDETYGATQFIDDSDNDNHGTCTGGVCPQAGVAIQGQVGLATEFDGQDDMVEVPDDPALQLGSFSVGAWVMPTAVKQGLRQSLVTKGFYSDIAGAMSSLNYELYIKGGDLVPVFGFGIGCGYDYLPESVTSDVPLILNVWNHVMGTFQFSGSYDDMGYEIWELKIYVNGSEQDSEDVHESWALPCTSSTQPLQIGGLSDKGDDRFAGRMDEVTIHDYALSAQEIHEIYLYQGGWVEDRQNHDVTVDADAPTSALRFDASYWPDRDVQMYAEAQDATSSVALVELGVKRYSESDYAWTSAPRCTDAIGDAAWCPTFVPSGDGRYDLRTRATDLVGNVFREPATTMYVDDAPPDLGVGAANGARLDAFLSPTVRNAWAVPISGTVGDPALSSGDPGSGVPEDGVLVTLLAPNGTIAGQGQQAMVTEGTWSLEYVLPEAHSTGWYTVHVEAVDEVARLPNLEEEQIARHTATVERRVQVDATAPAANLDWANLPAGILGPVTLQGDATERPVPVAVAWTTDDGSGHQASLEIECRGLTLYSADPGAFVAQEGTYTWNDLVHRDAACQVSVTSGILSGTIEVCGDQVASWASGTSGAAFAADSAACESDTAFAGMDRVELAFAPHPDGSPFYNEVPPEGQLVHIPFEDAPFGSGAIYFRDIAGNTSNSISLRHDGRCADQHCPSVGEPGPTGSAAWFDGEDDYVDLGRSEINQLTNDFSVMAWIKPDWLAWNPATLPPEDRGVQWILGTFRAVPVDTNTSGFGFGVGGVGYGLRFSTFGEHIYDTTDVTLSTDAWYHVAAVMNADNSVTFYVNGQAAETVAHSAPANPDANIPLLVSVPGRFYPDYPFSGLMDDVRVFDRALSAAEMEAIYVGSGPLLALPLDEPWAVNRTILADASGRAHHATLYGQDWGADANKAEPGKVGAYALDFDGVGDYIVVAPYGGRYSKHYEGLDLSGGRFTQAAWVYPSPQHDGVYPILSSGARSADRNWYPFTHIVSRTQLSVGFGDGTDLNTFTTGSILTENAWNHVATTFDGATYRVYVDGAQRASTDQFTGKTPYPTQRLDIGRGRDASDAQPCAQIELKSMVEGSWAIRYEVLFDGAVIFRTEAYATPDRIIPINVSRGFCGSAPIEVRYQAYTNLGYQWFSLGTYTPDITPGPGSYTFADDDSWVKLEWDVTVDPSQWLFFQGRLDDVRVYPRALSAREVQALYDGSWQTSTLAASGAGVGVADWSAPVPIGLEGVYRLDLRGWDAANHPDNGGRSQNAWRGEADTLAPRVTMTREVVGSDYRYTTVAQDFNLTEDGFQSPCGAGAITAREYYRSPWYTALSGQTDASSQKLYQLTAVCDVPVSLTWLQEVGTHQMSEVGYDVVVSGTYAYVAAEDGLHVLDVSDPSSPHHLGLYETPVAAVGVAVSGNYAYVPDNGTTMTVVDISDPSNPRYESEYISQGLSGIAISGDFVYLIGSLWGLEVLDISDPSNPQFRDSLVPTGSPYGVTVSGNYAYVYDNIAGDLEILNVSDPDNIGSISTYDLPAPQHTIGGVAVSGSYVYVADGYAGLRIVDVSNSATPTETGFYRDPTLFSYAEDVVISGTQAYVAADRDGLWVLDVSDPSTPREVSAQIDFERWAEGTTDYQSVAVSGNYAHVIDQHLGLRVVDLRMPTEQATACDAAGNCTTVGATPALARAATSSRITGILSGSSAPVGVSIAGVPPVVDATPLSIEGQAYAITSSLRALTVTVDGALNYSDAWATGTTTETTWLSSWTSSVQGPHTIQALVIDWEDNAASDTITFTLDTEPPTISIAPTVLTSTHYYPSGILDLTGMVTDTAGLESVEVVISATHWLSASYTGDAAPGSGQTWQALWELDQDALPDGATYTVTAQATDVAWHKTWVTESVLVDVVSPAPVTLTLSSDGSSIARGDTLRVLSPTLTLTWTTSSDGSGPVGYPVAWTIVTTGTHYTIRDTHNPTRTSQYTAGDGQKTSVQLASRDAYGNQRRQSFGPVYVDSPRTPDYVLLDDPDGAYCGWMESGCTLVGVDRRVARAARGGAVLDAEQSLYATWNSEALRLAWTGANWNTDGDLFVYLDIQAGGAITTFNPYLATFTNTVIYLPGVTPISQTNGMAADYLVWVRDSHTALLLRWDGSTWDFETALAAEEYRFDPALHDGHTDLYLPFDLLGIVDPASTTLDMVAFASEEDGLRLWAAMPSDNPLNSARVIGTASFAGEAQAFALSRRYHWDGLGADLCPNGSDASMPNQYLDTDLEVRITVEPQGTVFSFLADDLFWLWDLVLGDRLYDVSSFFNFMDADHPPVRDGQAITYALSLYNRGADTATGLYADVSAGYALRLPDGDPSGDHQVVNLGDIGPGEEITGTFRGIVDVEGAYQYCVGTLLLEDCTPYQRWAVADAMVYDDAHAPSGPPLERVWVDHQVDYSGPSFFGIQQPAYLIGPGTTTVRGYAYDDAGVPTMTLEIRPPSGLPSTITCPDDAPADGAWSCAWDATASNGGVPPDDGDVFDVRLQATDGFGQRSAWSDWQSFQVDAAPPTITLDVTATQVFSGALVSGSALAMVGDEFDDGGVKSIDVCVDGECRSANMQLGAGVAAAVYDDVAEPPVAIGSGTACGGGEIVRTFTVTESFTVGRVGLGFTAEHTRRDDVRVELRSPEGTGVWVLNDDDVSGTQFRNYDVFLDDTAPTGLADVPGDHDPEAPFYDHLARPYEPLQAFQGESSAGNWTLRICDLNPSLNNGTYRRSRLVLTPRHTAAPLGRWYYHTPVVGSLDYVSQTITIYGQDVVGNRTVHPPSLVVWVDNVPPVITMTGTSAVLPLGSTMTVLSGTVSDGGPVADVFVHVRTPGGEFRRQGAARGGDRWWFDLQSLYAGNYTVWVNASDRVGNITTVGPFQVLATLEKVYLPLMVRNWRGLGHQIWLPLVMRE